MATVRRGGLGISPLVSEIILLAGVIAIGLAIWGLSIGMFGVTTTKNTQEYDAMISSQRILLIIEVVDGGAGSVWVSNHGLNDVVVISCTIYSKSLQSPGYRPNMAQAILVPKDPSVLVSFSCEKIGSPPYVAEVWYLPSHLYDPNDPTKNIHWAGVARYDTTERQ